MHLNTLAGELNRFDLIWINLTWFDWSDLNNLNLIRSTYMIRFDHIDLIWLDRLQADPIMTCHSILFSRGYCKTTPATASISQIFRWSDDLICRSDDSIFQTFRDLKKPMGAQSESRLEQFLKRYRWFDQIKSIVSIKWFDQFDFIKRFDQEWFDEINRCSDLSNRSIFREWDDPTGETPPYMYGTHYSSAMIVLSYLVRLEPFTQQFLKLQVKRIDRHIDW